MADLEETETSGPRSGDPLWQAIREQVQHEARRERRLSRLLHANVLDHGRLEDALAFVLSQKLASPLLGASVLREVCAEAFRGDREIGAALRRDLEAICQRDPACRGEWIPMLYYKGFHALAVHRASHWLWSRDQHVMALHLQNRASELFGVDIHPAARIGAGIFIDHATGVVMGETCVVEDDVSLLHEVTLGGTGKETGDRHPKVRRGVLICAGAKVLGNVEVGEGAKVAAGSVVLEDVPPHSTVAGVPAVLVGRPRVEQPALEMDSRLSTE